jgi:tetratricopeptide (TPR) repeat protein
VLHWKGEFQKAVKIIKEIEIPVEFCNQARISYAFHSQAGMIFRGIKQYDTAIYHYNKAIEIGEQLDNWSSVASNHNNLAFLYNKIRNFELAHYHIEVSLQIFQKLNQNGWIAQVLDTKSLIYFAENKFELSLQTIDAAIDQLQVGDDFASLVDAMWTKVRCLLALNQKEDAILLFARLTQTAQINIGEVAVIKYTKLFTDIIYIKQDDLLENKVAHFKKTEIVNALRQTDYNFEESAIELGYSTTNKLIKVLNTEFPELYQELGIQPRAKQPKVKNIKKSVNEFDEKNNSPAPKLINQLMLRNVKFEFDATLNTQTTGNIKTFYCSPEKMTEVFNISFDAVLAVKPLSQTKDNQFVLIKKFNNNDYQIVRLTHDKNFDVSILLDKDIPLSFDEVEIIGTVIGFCSFDDADNDTLYLTQLPKF